MTPAEHLALDRRVAEAAGILIATDPDERRTPRIWLNGDQWILVEPDGTPFLWSPSRDRELTEAQ